VSFAAAVTKLFTSYPAFVAIDSLPLTASDIDAANADAGSDEGDAEEEEEEDEEEDEGGSASGAGGSKATQEDVDGARVQLVASLWSSGLIEIKKSGGGGGAGAGSSSKA
jgi:hypothetical protein